MKVSERRLVHRGRIGAAVLAAALLVAVAASVEGRAAWLAELCGFLGDGCRDTARYRFLGLPVAPVGVAFYAALAWARLRGWRGLLRRGVMLGAGFELVLLGIMAADGFLCVFCAANALLLALLWLCQFERGRGWETAALLLLGVTLGDATVGGGGIWRRGTTAEATLATVGGRRIGAGEVERPLTTEIHKLEQRIYELKRTLLEVRIDDELLALEADTRGVTVEAILAEVRAQATPAADRVVEHYYETGLYRKWGTAEGTPEELRTKIRDYLLARDTGQLLAEHCQALRSRFPVRVLLRPPPLPSTKVRIEGAPAVGPANAPVTVVEFSDYLCPVCRQGHATVARVREKYRASVRWVFKDNPLDRHPGAKELAMAARCADEQGRFWAYQEKLFGGEQAPAPDDALRFAEELGLDTHRFRACLNPQLAAEVAASAAEAREAGVTSTPSFLINGQLHVGVPSFEEFCRLVDEALDQAASGRRGRRDAAEPRAAAGAR